MIWLEYPTLDDAIDAWHEDSTELSLHEWLGLTDEEYDAMRSHPEIEYIVRGFY